VTRLLAAASIVWPLLLAGGWWAGVEGRAPLLTTVVYLSAGRVCHQKPDRSFTTAGVQWPVCGRCAGLYLGAPFGALAALAWWRRSGAPRIGWLVAAALPTAVTMAVEFGGLAPMSSLARALAATLLGAAVAFFMVAVTHEKKPGIISGDHNPK